MSPSKHTRSHSNSQIVSPLSDLETLVREPSFRRRLEDFASSYVPLQPEEILASDPFRTIPSQLDLVVLTPMVLDILNKGVDLQSALLIQSLESYKIPEIFSDSPKLEEEFDAHLPELKPTYFISPTHYTFPSTSAHSKETFYVYSNPLFDNKEQVEK